MEDYDYNNHTLRPFIQTIVPHCEMLLHHFQKANDPRLDNEESFTFFKKLSLYFTEKNSLQQNISCLKYCLNLTKKLYGTSHINTSMLIKAIGIVLHNQNKLEEAKDHYKEALEIQNKVYGTKNHLEVATTIYNIGLVLQEQGKLDEAEAHYKEVLEIETKTYGTRNHPDVAKTIHQIGTLLQLQSKFHEAKAQYQEALAIETKVHGTKYHPDIATAIHNIGTILHLQGKLDELKLTIENLLKLKPKHMELKIILRLPKPFII